jgi:transcriptional regulator with XRE-family HTH domain
MTKKKTLPFDYKTDIGIQSRFRQVIETLGKRADAARIAGVTEDMIRKYLQGHSSPALDVAARLCTEAGFSMDWLITGSIQPTDKRPIKNNSQKKEK